MKGKDIGSLVFLALVLVLVVYIVVKAGQAPVPMGTITQTSMYSGASHISGVGAEGAVADINFYQLTIVYDNQTFHATVTCSLYPVGSQIELGQFPWGVQFNSAILPPSCQGGS